MSGSQDGDRTQLEMLVDGDVEELDLLQWQAEILTATGEAKTIEEARVLAKLRQAVESDDEPTVRQILAEGIAPDRVVFGETLLAAAIGRASLGVAKLLIESGADPNLPSEGVVPLQAAVHYPEIIELLLTKGANPNPKRSRETWPPLAGAALSGNARGVELLAAADAELEATCEMVLGRTSIAGCTAIFGAILLGHHRVVKGLIDAGANVNHRNRKGQRPLDWVENLRPKAQTKVREVLLQAGAQPGSGIVPEETHNIDFRSRGKSDEFEALVSEWSRRLKVKPVALDVDSEARGGAVFLLKEPYTLEIAAAEEAENRGALLFASRDVATKGGDCLVLLPTTDPIEAVAAVETNGANWNVYPEDVIDWLRKLRADYAVRLLGIGVDFLDLRFQPPVASPEDVAKRIIAICPAAEDEDDALRKIARRVGEGGRVFLWWD